MNNDLNDELFPRGVTSEATDPYARPVPRWIAVLTVTAALILLSLWLIGTPPGLLGKADAIGYAICHRIAERSFFVQTDFIQSEGLSVQAALCARCMGIYLGVMTALAMTGIRRRLRADRLPSRWLILTLLGFIVVMGVDGLNSYIRLFPGLTGVYESQNWLRLATGMYCGIALFNLILPLFNTMVWTQPDDRRALESPIDLLAQCIAGAAVIVLVLGGGPLFLSIFNILSAVGVVLMLTMIATVLYLNVINRVRSIATVRGLLIPLIGGLLLTLIEIGGVNILRYALTGTWAGFVIPG